jgi:hypothetical protein
LGICLYWNIEFLEAGLERKREATEALRRLHRGSTPNSQKLDFAYKRKIPIRMRVSTDLLPHDLGMG